VPNKDQIWCQNHCTYLRASEQEQKRKHLQSTFCQQQNHISFFTITFLFIFISSDEFSSRFVGKLYYKFIALNFENTTNLRWFFLAGKIYWNFKMKTFQLFFREFSFCRLFQTNWVKFNSRLFKIQSLENLKPFFEILILSYSSGPLNSGLP
jgi:hypothetical protein